jgi:TPP-dependent pyruvate/acetoin dehydrogenase alpha subunit
VTLTREQHLELYYWLRLTRAVDDQLALLYRQGKLVGGCYSSRGQEAISCASAYALRPDDYLGPMIRNAGAVLVKGFRPRDIFTQYMGKATSPTGGKDGSSHFGDLNNLRVIAPISHLGSLIPVLAGIGMAARMQGKDCVCLTYIGDGGASVGEVHEGLNFAAVMNCPLVLILENNGFAYSTPVDKQARVRDFARRAAGYGIPGVIVDGNDVPAVYRVTCQAVERARAGKGPTLIEAKTFRMKGHAEHDSASYVPKKLLDAWAKKDPIARFEKLLVKKGWLPAARKSEIEERVRREIAKDLAFAEGSPMPDGQLALEGVFAE